MSSNPSQSVLYSIGLMLTTVNAILSQFLQTKLLSGLLEFDICCFVTHWLDRVFFEDLSKVIRTPRSVLVPG